LPSASVGIFLEQLERGFDFLHVGVANDRPAEGRCPGREADVQEYAVGVCPPGRLLAGADYLAGVNAGVACGVGNGGYACAAANGSKDDKCGNAVFHKWCLSPLP